MTVSFIVIAYNEQRMIAQTIEAILAQQNLPEHEIIVVNDGSRDKTLAIVQERAAKHPSIAIIDQPNKGRGAARAVGVRAAKGDYLAFIDGDILLPPDWLQRCLAYMKEYDAVGGIAVPDGDVAFVHRVAHLKPKAASHTVSVSGGNGLFKRQVFDKVGFEADRRNGEDVAFNRAMTEHGLRTTSIPDLLVEHCEYKNYRTSLSWLFESGQGASRQLYEQRRLRLPDIAFFGFVIGVIVAIIFGLLTGWWWLSGLAVFLYVTASSFMHLREKFYLNNLPTAISGIIINDSLLVSYYIGRLAGVFTEWNKR